MNDSTEYMRRNLLAINAEEAHKRALAASKRLERMKRPPKWLVKAVAGIIQRTEPLSDALTDYRDQATTCNDP